MDKKHRICPDNKQHILDIYRILGQRKRVVSHYRQRKGSLFRCLLCQLRSNDRHSYWKDAVVSLNACH